MTGSIIRLLQSFWTKGIQNQFNEVLNSFGLVISVYIGFYLGFVITQMDRIGQALLLIKADNSTNLVSPWILQASQSIDEFQGQTLIYALFLVPLLVVPRLTNRHHASFLTSMLFPALVSLSWLVLPAATLPASIPETFVTIVGSSKDISISVTQIYTYLVFNQSFVVALRGLCVITSLWTSTRLIGLKKHILWDAIAVGIPVGVWFAVLPILPIPFLIISAITSSVEITPVGVAYPSMGAFSLPVLGTISDILMRLAFLIWLVSILFYAESRLADSKGYFAPFQRQFRKTSSTKHG